MIYHSKGKDMLKLETVRKTHFFAIKNTIQESMNLFIENPEEYFIEATISYEDFNENRHVETVTIRREIISQFYGTEFSNYEKSGGGELSLKENGEYIQLWVFIVKNQPKNIQDAKDDTRKGFLRFLKKGFFNWNGKSKKRSKRDSK